MPPNGWTRTLIIRVPGRYEPVGTEERVHWREHGMRYVMKQKFWSWGDDFTIRDESGRDVFFVDGRAFSWGDKLSFQDMQKNELAFIRQKLLSWGPTYEITSSGRLVAV